MTTFSFYLYAFLARVFRHPHFIVRFHRFKRRYLRLRGISIGANTVIYGSTFSKSGKGDKFFIGKDCVITGVTFLGHDAAPGIFLKELQKEIDPCLPGARESIVKPVHVCDRVFIGRGCIILPGAFIESDVVIGAGSVVSGRLKEGYVYAGNPAKQILTLQQYLDKQKIIADLN